MGYAMVSGGKPDMAAPSAGILASELAVGSVVKLMEGGVATEYMVVNQGKPSGSSLYDDSCDGTWLLRKDIKENRAWHSSNVNDYENSTIHSYLNSTFLGLLDANVQSAIKQVKLPYRKGSGTGTTITSGVSGLSAKIFLLSGAEVNWSSSISSFIPNDGACLSYFSGCATTDRKRIANLDGSATIWWLRSPFCSPTTGSTRSLHVYSNGSWNTYDCSNSCSIRPALVLPSNALFETKTLILKGVA